MSGVNRMLKTALFFLLGRLALTTATAGMTTALIMPTFTIVVC